MKIDLKRESLLKPLQMAIGVVERKQAMPILSNVLISLKNKKLSITGTDTEVELIGHLDFDDEDDKTLAGLTVPGRKLMDICRALPENASIELYQEKEKVILRSGRSRFALSTLPAQDFPNLGMETGFLAFTMPQNQLKSLLQRTYFAMAQQDVRYYLNGLLLETEANKLTAVATDGHRLALTAVDCVTNATNKVAVIVPRKGVLELMRLLEDSDQEIGITFSNGHIHVAATDFCFTSKLIEGRFPDYQRVIPRNGNKFVLLDRDTLKQALSRSAILCNEKFKGVRFELNNNLLKITTINPEQESAEEELSIDYSHEPLDIGFNISYLLDVLNTLDGGEIKLTFSDSASSVIIEGVNNPWQNVYVVMPMRL